MKQLRRDVYFVPRDFGGAFLIDLSGDSYALPPDQAALVQELVRGDHGISSNGLSQDIPEEFIEALEALSLIDQPKSGRSRRLAALNALRAKFVAACLYTVLAFSKSPKKLTSRLLALSYVFLKLCPWTVVVESWTEFFKSQMAMDPSANDVLEIACTEELLFAAASRSLFAVRCKERSLTLFALLRLTGHPARVHVGCCPTIFQLHCWLESSQRVVGDDESLCADFNSIASWS